MQQLTNEHKKQIATGAYKYAQDQDLSNNEVAKATGINAGYISNIFRGIFTVEVKGTPTDIGNTHFLKLATWAGITIEKQYWKVLQTLQHKEILATLNQAKQNPRAFLIINDTGAGKTTAIDVFTKVKAKHTFRITVGDSYKIEDIVNELGAKVGVDADQFSKRMKAFNLKMRLNMISERLLDIRHAGGNPVIILDEAENLKPAVLRTIKELYDAIIKHCSIVMIGTEQIVEAMLNRRNKNRVSVPQVYRRFKAGIRNITPINKSRDFSPFYKAFDMDENFGNLLNAMADNYGELHDFLEPVLRYADENNKEFNMELFKLYHNI